MCRVNCGETVGSREPFVDVLDGVGVSRARWGDRIDSHGSQVVSNPAMIGGRACRIASLASPYLCVWALVKGLPQTESFLNNPYSSLETE